jgi:hypothetical protein
MQKHVRKQEITCMADGWLVEQLAPDSTDSTPHGLIQKKTCPLDLY